MEGPFEEVSKVQTEFLNALEVLNNSIVIVRKKKYDTIVRKKKYHIIMRKKKFDSSLYI